MRPFYQLIGSKIRKVRIVVSSLISIQSYSQNILIETDRAIEKLRKGAITIKAKPGEKITVEQLRHDFWFGCAIPNGVFSNGFSEKDIKQFKENFLKNFNAAVTENAVKWGQMEKEKGIVNYDLVDSILEWTDENDIPLRGHNIFWGVVKFVPAWVKELNDDDLKATLQKRAESITSRYKGRFAEYDLNNEMVHGNYYEDRLGPDITKRMAQWVHNGDTDANLFVNDFNIATGKKLSEYMTQIRTLLKQGVPIAGIGIQGHSHSETFDRYELKRALDSLAVFNLPVRITEFNMPGQSAKFSQNKEIQLTIEEEQQKANEIVDFYSICFAHPAVTGILMWGFWEGANWIPTSSLYKKDWTPTPAADAYYDLIYKKWWTVESGVADNEGLFSISAFYGKYKVTVGNDTKIVEFKPKQGSILVDFNK